MIEIIHAKPQALKDLFDNTKTYVIPDYQRPYSWREDECTQLWEDLSSFYEDIRSDENNQYFLGNMVCYKNTTNNNYYVVDGQQRLTSLLILLKILHEKAVNFVPLYKLIWKTEDDFETGKCKLQQPLSLNLYSEVLGGEDIKNFHLVMNTNIDDIKEKKESLNSAHISNYFLLKEKVEEWYTLYPNEYEKFIRTIISKVFLLPIECDNQDHALTIFETINNRGKSLNDADIFKAQLYKLALNTGEKDIFIEQWNEISKMVKSIKNTNSIVDLFRIYTHIIRGKTKDVDTEIGLRKFFTTKSIKNRAGLELSKQASWQPVLQDLSKLADCQMFLNKYAPDRIKKWWNTLTLVANTYIPHLLYTYLFYHLDESNLSKDDLKEFERLCQACTKFFYGKRLCQISQTEMKHTIYQCIAKLTLNNNVEEIVSELKKATTDNLKDIEERINDSKFGRVRAPLVHILAYHYDNQKFIEDVSIEHILPKKWGHYEFTHWSTELVKENIEKLGNIVLLEFPLNRYANNHIFSYKKDNAYNKSEFQACKELLLVKEWDLESFYERDRKCKNILKNFFRNY